MKKTYIVIALDSSGSMGRIKQYALDGYNEQVQQIQADAEAQKGENEYFVCVVTFNKDVFEHHWLVPASELQLATNEDYITKGSTNLYDTQGYCFDKLMKTTNPEDPESAYLMIMITDGEHMEPKTVYSKEDIAEMCSSLQKTGKWTITYMGCNKDYLESYARSTNVPLANCALWVAEAASTKFAFASNRNSIKNYGQARMKGVTSMNDFHSADAENIADYSLTAEIGDVGTPSAEITMNNIGVPTSPEVNQNDFRKRVTTGVKTFDGEQIVWNNVPILDSKIRALGQEILDSKEKERRLRIWKNLEPAVVMKSK